MIKRTAFLLFSIAFLATAIAIEAREIPMRDFFKNPEKTGYQISPDGKHLSYLGPYEGRLNIFVMETGAKDAKRITSDKDRDNSNYFWKNNKRILYVKDNGGDENYKIYGIDIDGKNKKCLTDFDKVRTGIIDILEDNDDEILIEMNKRNPQIFDAYRLNINTGELKMIAENPGNIRGWMTDHKGKLRVAFASDGVNQSVLYRDSEDQQFKSIITTNFNEQLAPQFFDFENKNIYASSNIGRDKSVIVEYDIKNGKEIRVLYENPDYDVSSLAFSKKRKVITAAVYTSWKRELYYFDEVAKKRFERIQKELGKYEVSYAGASKNEDKFIIRTYSDRSLGAYYLYDENTDKLTHIADISPWLKEDEMAEMKPIKYKSRDGLTIHGYLTLPKGKDPKNLPVVINPHGGPWFRDSWRFNPEIQFLANRGFAVLQMNFRGSTGYGKKFWEASFKQWGKTMQDDITDGVKWLIEQGIADKNKVAIYGGSYGGYATLAGLTFTPDLYAAGVDYVGVSNLFTFMKTIPPYWKPYLDMFYEMVGDPVKDKAMMEAASPVFHADKIKAPLLVAQGANDPRVNKDESDQMVSALKKRGIDVEYIVKTDEGHGFHNEENRFEFYESMEKFLKRHLLN
jgi:dipeptidyl aminopeptidase/acylaminoacyl peptidase